MAISSATISSITSVIGLIAGLGSAVASRRVGRIEQEAFREESRAVQLQGAIAREEAEEEAERQELENIRFQEQQRVTFLKSGVSLAGSPLLVLAETEEIGAKEVAAVRRRGAAQFGLASARARALRKRGKARLIGRTTEGLATGVEAISGFAGEVFK